MEKEIKLTESNFCYRNETEDVYHVGNFKIRLFSTLEGFITEQTCFRLSKVETTRILVPKPVYQNGRYVGCKTKWKDKDWIYSFYGKGNELRNNLLEMKEEIEMLSRLGIDLGNMPFYYSYYGKEGLTFDGTFRMQESNMKLDELRRMNQFAYQDYLRGLVYNGLSEFEVDPEMVANYLYEPGETIDKRLIKALDGKKQAGQLIREDIYRNKNK